MKTENELRLFFRPKACFLILKPISFDLSQLILAKILKYLLLLFVSNISIHYFLNYTQCPDGPFQLVLNPNHSAYLLTVLRLCSNNFCWALSIESKEGNLIESSPLQHIDFFNQ